LCEQQLEWPFQKTRRSKMNSHADLKDRTFAKEQVATSPEVTNISFG
jgi:hypothetical protein